MEKDELRTKILALVRDYHAKAWTEKTFSPGRTHIPYSGRVFDQDELINLVDASLDFWLTTRRFADQFESEFASITGTRYASLCNSGSSANLLAVSALTSPRLGDRRLVEGDEVITAAAGFPTTVNPIIQNRLVPVFVDIDLGTYNASIAAVESAIGSRTKAIVLAHTMGNPFDVRGVMELVEKHKLWLVEDNCDALGSTYGGTPTGAFGDCSTASFYPAHHITMGEGGCVMTSNAQLKTIIQSFRDWGRDCYCQPGHDDTCGKRFDWQLGSLPHGYDHKYIFSHIGYNLKLTDMQAAVGLAQLKKLPHFISRRKINFNYLREGLKPYQDYLILPEATENSDPSWFGFIITVQENAPFSRGDLRDHLEKNKIATRSIFGGNLTRQPAYSDIKMRVEGDLANSDFVMRNSLVIGVYPGIEQVHLDYVLDVFKNFFTS